MIYLDVEDLVHVGSRLWVTAGCGASVSWSRRPPGPIHGVRRRRLPSIHDKAASLLHSLAGHHPLVDGDGSLALAATIGFYGVSGVRLTLSNDEAYDLVIAIAAGDLDDVGPIAERLRWATAPWR